MVEKVVAEPYITIFFEIEYRPPKSSTIFLDSKATIKAPFDYIAND